MPKRYQKSEEFFEKAIKRIPLASQTFSKSITQYPYGAAPLFIKKAKGSIAVDLDGNRYIDLVASLGAVTIGYADSGQIRSIKKQLKRGSIFSLPSTVEYEVAELLCTIIPSAEKVRFAKNGTDATSGAIRLARAYTGKNHVIACGYHGWQDWFVAGTSKNLGVPKVLERLIHNVKFGDVDEVKTVFEYLQADVAAVIVEPFSSQYPVGDYLHNLRKYCSEKGILLIFDETVTGFRVSTGGAQELVQVTPDLSCFGKGLANGYPLAALVGKHEIMDLMKDVFLSGTFGGDTISLAAARFSITKYIDDGVAAGLECRGRRFQSQLDAILNKETKEVFSLVGHPSWFFHKWSLPEDVDTDAVKTLFLQELLKNGVMALSTINVMFALSDRQIDQCAETYAHILNEIAVNLDDGWITSRLQAKPIRPLFRIRNS